MGFLNCSQHLASFDFVKGTMSHAVTLESRNSQCCFLAVVRNWDRSYLNLNLTVYCILLSQVLEDFIML